jgi:portal protein
VAFWDIWRRRDSDVTEAKAPAKTPDPGSAKQPERAGYLFGVPEAGLDDIQAGMGASTGTDRKSMLQELYEAYLACPWSWACVNAIARTVTSGGLVTDWDSDTGEGNQDAPDKPPEVLALEAFLDYCNPTQDIRQVLRNAVADLEVFGGAYLEVAWWGSLPVAIWNQDYPTTTPVADAHGAISGYVQVSDYGQRATFEPRQIIYISLDSARAGVFGVSPTQAMMGPITAWLFGASTGKEIFRKGLPANVHVDLPPSMSEPETRRWSSQYMSGNLGAKNIGRPIVTRNGGKVNQLQAGRVADVLAFLDQKRDEIVAGYGVPPAKAGIIESGNLGGGTADGQDVTYRVDTCGPIADLILEKLNFHITGQGFGVKDWKLKFGEVDYRASLIIEQIRDMRLRNGTWTRNKYAAEIGEPACEGGNDPVLVDRQNLILWSDMNAMSKAIIAGKGAPAVTAGETPPGGEQMSPDAASPDDDPDDDGKPPAAAGKPAAAPPARESWQRRYAAYLKRLSVALDVLPPATEEGYADDAAAPARAAVQPAGDDPGA